MFDPTRLLEHWGYGALCAVILLGNVGVPVPEETVLGVAGYLVWRGDLQFMTVVVVGVMSASVGDSLGFFLGRRGGGTLIGRHAARVGIPPRVIDRSRRFVVDHGAMAVFVARFLPGLRFAAGPVAGALGMPPHRFGIANVLGACTYVPLVVGSGYAIGTRFGPFLDAMLATSLAVEHLALGAGTVAALAAFVWRLVRRRPTGAA